MKPKEITQTLGHQQNRNNILKTSIDPQERIQFSKEMEKARQDMTTFKENMSNFIEQMNKITTELENSKDRVSKIEHNLTITQEDSVNLQVLLEKAVKVQREDDTSATQSIKHVYSKLALIVYENSQIQGKLALLEKQQKIQQGNVQHAAKRIDEYTHMLERAQGTIHTLQEPPVKSPIFSRRTSHSSWAEM